MDKEIEKLLDFGEWEKAKQAVRELQADNARLRQLQDELMQALEKILQDMILARFLHDMKESASEKFTKLTLELPDQREGGQDE